MSSYAPNVRRSEDDVVFKVKGPNTPQQLAAERTLHQTQAEVDEVVGIIRMNVEKILEREEKQAELEERTKEVQEGAKHKHPPPKRRQKICWRNVDKLLLLGLLAIFIVGDYYLTKWLLANYCLQDVLGFQFCSNGTSTTGLHGHIQAITSGAFHHHQQHKMKKGPVKTLTTTSAPSHKVIEVHPTPKSAIEVEQVKVEVKNNVRWLNRGYNVLDPAVEVEPVLDAAGKQVFDHNGLPVYRTVHE